MMNYLSTYDGVIYRRDIENFKYSCLRSSDSDFLDEIRLPPIYINNRQGTVSVLVPDNTPIGTADVDGRRRSRRKSFVRYQHGVIDDDDERETSSVDDYDECDNFLTVRSLGGGGGGSGDALSIPRDRRDRRLTFAPDTRRTSVSFPSFEFGDTNHRGVHGGDNVDAIDGHVGVDYGDTYGGQVGHFGRHGSGRAGSSKGFDGDGYAHYHRGSVSRRNSFYDQDRDKQLTPGGHHRAHVSGDQSNRSGGTRHKWSMIPGSGSRTTRDHVPGSGRGADAHDRGHSTDQHGAVQQGVTFADGTFLEEEMAPASAEASGHLPPIAGKTAHPDSSQMEYGVAARPTRKPFHQLGFWQQMDIFKRAQRNAYATALATAQLRRPIPAEPWMFGSRIARAFVFSYFGTSRKGCGAADDPGTADKPAKSTGKGKKKKKKKKKKKLSEMKSIFGDVMPHDYYPGGKRNLDGYTI